MATKIRLARGGAKKKPYYAIVVSNARSPRDGRFIEKIGTYNPVLAKDDPNRVTFKEDRLKHWLATGATPTDRVARMLGAAGFIEKPVFNNPKKALPGKKAQERLEAAKLAEEEAAAAAAEAEAPAEDAAPAEEAAEGEAAQA